MKKKELFIAFSDIQIEDWKRFSSNRSRLNHSLTALKRIAKHATDLGVPVLFAGDFFDNAKELSNIVINETFKTYKRCMGNVSVYAISGNHDQSESNTDKHSSPTHLELYDNAFSRFTLLDGKYKSNGGIRIHGIPYLKNNIGFVDAVKKAKKNLSYKRKNILLVHTDFHNIQHSKKRTSGQVENLPRKLRKLFDGFDLVLSGHIHMPQEIIPNKIIMLGATNHQRVSDVGIDMGYWVFYDDLSYRFIKLDLPQFKYGEDKKDGHFYIEPNKVNKVRKKGTITSNFTTTNTNKLAKNYLIATDQKDKDKLRILKKYLANGLS